MIKTIIAFCVTLASAATATTFAADRPNILYFYVDDMGWGSIGPNGQQERKEQGLPYVRTPNIDQLAAQGVNFRRGYGCHVCSPARSSQQTGFHQGHTFADRNDPNNAKKAIRADDITMGDALAAAGYSTGYWGKWGYGGSKDQVNPTLDNIQTLPTSHGYQFVLAELHHVRAHTFFQPTLWSAPTKQDIPGGLELAPNSLVDFKGESSWPNFPALQNHRDYPEIAYCDDSYAFACLDFVRRQATNYNATGQPFLGILAVQIPHAPFGEISTLPDWNQSYANDPKFEGLSDQTKQWAAMVTRIDAHFGNILQALEDPNNDGSTEDSVVNNTLVVFQSDNGGPAGKNNVELNANGGLSGNKGRIQEGGIRVPLVMRWPAKIKSDSSLRQGTNSDRVVDVTDLLPTFCELAGTKPPLGIDGVSLAPTLCGSGFQRSRQFIVHEASNGQSIIQGRHKLVRRKTGQPQLFDIEEDPSESKDIANNHPELVNQLETLLLGERVAEPKGFCNTYHHWLGGDNDSISDANNWSVYEYSNAGITYIRKDGAPEMSWIGKIYNKGSKESRAICSSDAQFLGLEVRGNPEKSARQLLVIEPEAEIVGRNEIRISDLGVLELQEATVTTLRWLDIATSGTLSGSGTINGSLFNEGSLEVDCERNSLVIHGDLHQGENSQLRMEAGGIKAIGLTVDGNCMLSGKLRLNLPDQAVISKGSRFRAIVAKRIDGNFSNVRHEVVASNGTRFDIEYGTSEVTLVAK